MNKFNIGDVVVLKEIDHEKRALSESELEKYERDMAGEMKIKSIEYKKGEIIYTTFTGEGSFYFEHELKKVE